MDIIILFTFSYKFILVNNNNFNYKYIFIYIIIINVLLYSKAFITRSSMKVMAYAVVISIFSFPRFVVRKSPYRFRISTIEDKIITG